jgi:hypothetical protein
MTKTDTALQDPDDTPEVRTARAALDASIQRHHMIDDLLRRRERVLNRHVETAATEDELLDAHENIVETGIEHARATRELRNAEAAWQTARAQARDRLREVLHDQKRPLMARLNGALEEAARASRELAALEDQERSQCGDWAMTGLSWAELADPTPLVGSRLADWRKAAIEANLLDPALWGSAPHQVSAQP